MRHMAPIDTARARDLLDDRIGRRSVVVTSQLPVADWHRQLNDPTLADAILDRLVHGAIRIELRGKSMQQRRRRRRNQGMIAAGSHASRGRIVTPLRGIGEAGRVVRQHGACAPLRLVGAHAPRAHHAPRPCSRAFGGGIADEEIAKGELPTTT